MSAPRVAAVVLNYNGRELTLESLRSLTAMTYPDCEICVVDNGSSDGSQEAVAEAFPGVHQVRVEENQGIANGLNHGLRWALGTDCEYILWLNNDIEAHPAMLDELVAVAAGDHRIGCVGPKIYYHGDRERLWSAGGALRFREAITSERGHRERDRGQYDTTGEVDYINGCAMLVRRSVMEDVGPWDPIYIVGVEDADLCTRMKRRGYRCWYAHKAVLWHKVSHTLGVYKPGRTFHTGRSTAIFARKFARRGQWVSYLLFAFATLPFAFVRELVKGNQAAVVAKARGLWEGLRLELPPLPDA